MRGSPVTRPLVSVGLPVYNGGRYLSQALESIAGQTFADFEVIIGDNASTDDTEEICRRFARADDRVRYYRFGANAGAAANYNRVFHLARGKYLKWTAHDDVLGPAMLERCVERFESAPVGTSVVYPRAEFIGASGEARGLDTDHLAVTDPRPWRRFAHLINTVNMANAIFGLVDVEVLGRTRLIGSFPGSDYVLLAELGMLGPILEVPEVHFYRRIHDESSQLANPRTRDRARWFDSRLGARRVHVPAQIRLIAEYERSALTLPTTVWQRGQCAAAAPVVAGVRWTRVALGRQRRRARHMLAGAIA